MQRIDEIRNGGFAGTVHNEDNSRIHQGQEGGRARSQLSFFESALETTKEDSYLSKPRRGIFRIDRHKKGLERRMTT